MTSFNPPQMKVTFGKEEPLGLMLKRAYLLLESGELKLARACVAQACASYPEEPLPHALQGAVEIAAGDLELALKLLRHASRKWPEHPAPQLYLAETFLLSQKVGQARRKVSAVLEQLEGLHDDALDRGWIEMARHLGALCEHIEPSQIPAPLRSHEEEDGAQTPVEGR